MGDWRAVGAVLDAARPATADVLASLALVSGLRTEVDDMERRLLELARDGGATWQQVAQALGLRSRQAAEQRWLRLTAAGPAPSGPPVSDDNQSAGLRAAASSLYRRLGRRQAAGTAGRPAATALARETLRMALDAPPGPLHDLVRLAVADLRTLSARRLGRTLAAEVTRVSTLLAPPAGG